MSLQDAKKFVAYFVAGEYGPGEQAAFQKWLRGATVQEWDSVADEHEALVERWPVTGIAPSMEWINRLESRLDSVAIETQTPVVEMRRMTRKKVWIAAASVAVLIAAGTVLYMQSGPKGAKDGVGQGDQAAVPVLAQCVDVPRGGVARQVILADGSKILLNSASTLKYPASFNTSERVVELSGEAFFDVAGDAGKPFKVMIKGAEVEVLGTRFDVMAYPDEPASKTTLVDGVVKIKSGSKEAKLKPGDQVEVNYPLPVGMDGTIANNSSPTLNNSSSTLQFNKDVNIGDVLGWQKGGVDFVDADVYAVMRSLARYYNVTFKYSSDLPTKKITAGFALQDGLQHNLQTLEHFFNVTFKTDGKIVTVSR